jgi:hypothetical protein
MGFACDAGRVERCDTQGGGYGGDTTQRSVRRRPIMEKMLVTGMLYRSSALHPCITCM